MADGSDAGAGVLSRRAELAEGLLLGILFFLEILAAHTNSKISPKFKEASSFINGCWIKDGCLSRFVNRHRIDEKRRLL